ncbi:HD domain-containing phosphohydrolase [Roseateles sp. L2-2]|uniref:HD domain-containing phosphohydrolase n=1 Tax=Roseateles sp. L2-2 TaxID=3422597 RepID=UPI003D35E3F3
MTDPSPLPPSTSPAAATAASSTAVAAGSRVPVLDAVRALAFVGDLSMGQPVDHSTRAAWLATQIAEAARADGLALGRDADLAPGHAACVALLRWSGCTANAPEFSVLMGDDVGGRDAMLSNGSAEEASALAGTLGEAALIHCEVAGEIARLLGLPANIERAMRHLFETWNGHGKPDGLSGDEVPAVVFHVALAGDLEIFSRVHGVAAALRHIGERSDAKYPKALVDVVTRNAQTWMSALDAGAHEGSQTAGKLDETLAALETPLELVADVIDLKLPWMTGLSRRVADSAREAGAVLGFDAAALERLHRAGLLHGIGRASVPNALWNEGRRLGEADREKLRLMPYWTGRAARRLSALHAEAELASYVDERMDGSGSFRSAAGAAIPMPARVLAAAAAWVTVRTGRPGAPALDTEAARAAMSQEVAAGRLDPQAADAVCGAERRRVVSPSPGSTTITLSARETEVLGRIAIGESNKEAAKVLGISPATVRTHLESAFRKLECSTRAAATLKAMTMGLLTV